MKNFQELSDAEVVGPTALEGHDIVVDEKERDVFVIELLLEMAVRKD